jgi:hypothetical protein
MLELRLGRRGEAAAFMVRTPHVCARLLQPAGTLTEPCLHHVLHC